MGMAGLRYGSASGSDVGIGSRAGCKGWTGPGDWVGKWLAKWQGRQTLVKASWTCASCFPTLSEFLLKQEDMYGINHRHRLGAGSAAAKDVEKERIVRYVREGKDLWADVHEKDTGEKWVFEEVVDNTDVPSFLLGPSKGQEGEGRGERFRYLLDRGGRDGGFRDWQVPGVEEEVEDNAGEAEKGEEKVIAIGK